MLVRAIRGATTVQNNDANEIIEETTVLLQTICEKNNLEKDNIISVFFTVTKDLNATFPAVAARQFGWKDIALLCTNEIDVPGSLSKCIRVLLHFNTNKNNNEIEHIYLNRAKILRPDLSKINIAIDGPAGAGKSTIAKIIAKRLGILYLDTGAMYRAVALKAINSGIDTRDIKALVSLAEDVDIKISYIGTEQQIYLDGENVTGKIRTPEVSVGASNVAVVPEVRLKMVHLQRKIAEDTSVIMDGRDIGTYVLPNANLKVFLTANVEERANRRYNELVSKGTINVSLAEVMNDIEYRDKNDSTRDFAPLSKSSDAVEIDTTHMTIDEVSQKILSLVEGLK